MFWRDSLSVNYTPHWARAIKLPKTICADRPGGAAAARSDDTRRPYDACRSAQRVPDIGGGGLWGQPIISSFCLPVCE